MRTATEIQHDLDVTSDDLRRLRLRRMRQAATGLLLVALALLLAVHAWGGAHPAWGYLAAFAEAALVGAMADWFAVVALFRHPLGLPIWHTAIIPNSKDDIGRNLGAFVENHFITEEAIGRKLRDADPARLLGAWLLDPQRAGAIGSSAAAALGQVVESLDHARIAEAIREIATRQLVALDLSGSAGELVDRLVQQGRHQELLDALLDSASAYLGDEDRQPAITHFILLALGVENALVRMAVNAYAPKSIASLKETLDAVRADPQHRWRGVCDEWMAEFAIRLKADPRWAERIRKHQAELVEGDEVQRLLAGLWDRIRSALQRDLAQEQPALARHASEWIARLGHMLVEDDRLRGRINRAIEDGSATLIREHRGSAGRFIEQQLARWTRDEMSQRIELAIGRDLQFIRINGTLVGGLIGVVIHAVKPLLG